MTETSTERELLYGEITDEILVDLRAGRQPDLQALGQRYPALAHRLESLVGELEVVLRCEGLMPAPAAADCLDQLPSRIGDFRIVRVLARGGMGVVYEAEQGSPPRRVALKVLPFTMLLDPLRFQRFQQEAQAAARLHHPHIVPVLDVGCERGLPYYAMQFVNGRSAAVLLHELRQAARGTRGLIAPTGASGARLSSSEVAHEAHARRVATWGLQAAEALHYAHEVGIIHRDVKPANLLLDESGDLWVTDFGLARLRGETELTATGDAVGTLRYMAPEQALGLKGVADHRVDVYGLGATLYELLTLQPAVPGEQREDVFRQLLHEEATPPRTLNPAIPVDLETVVLTALRKDPQERFATAQELAEDLRRFLDKRQVLARRPSLRDRARGWARRHASALAAWGFAVTAIAIALAVSTALIIGAYREVARKQNEAEQQRDFARRATEDMYTAVAVEWLDDQGHLEPVQRDFLEKALAYYQREAAERAGDADAVFRLALATLRCGALQQRLGNNDEALRWYERVREVLAALPESKASRVTALEGVCLREQGIVRQRMGDWPQADESYRAAIAALEEASAAKPSDAERRAELAQAIGSRAVLLQSRADFGEAESHFRRAFVLLTEVLQAAPDEPRYRHRLAMFQTSRTLLLGRIGAYEEAERTARQAVETFRDIVRRRPSSRNYQAELAGSLSNLARALADVSRHQDAEAAAQEGIVHARRLAEDFAAVPAYQERLASCLLAHAETLVPVGRRADCEREVVEACHILVRVADDFPQTSSHRQRLAEASLLLGKVRAMQRQRQAAGQKPPERARFMEPVAEAFTDAARLNRQLMAEIPNNPKPRADLVESLRMLGQLDSFCERLPEAAACYEEIDAILESSFLTPGQTSAFARWANEKRWQNAHTLMRLWDDAGKADKALDACRKAVALAKELAENPSRRDGNAPVHEARPSREPRDRTVADYRVAYAKDLNELTHRLAAAGKSAEAAVSGRAAVEVLQRIARDKPDDGKAAQELADAQALLRTLSSR